MVVVVTEKFDGGGMLRELIVYRQITMEVFNEADLNGD